ncbi:MAG: hypothetical protein ACRD6I_07985, partial [Candidatus Acidiferrales bacterium]
PAVPTGAGPAQTAGVIGAPDRQLIQQIVARVFQQRGIARGGNAAVNVAPGFSPAPEQDAPSEQGAPNAGLKAGATEPAISAPIQAKKQEPAPVSVVAFVSEADVRRALTKGEKIYIGPKTIVTPAARDLGGEHEVLVETKPA